MLYFVDVHTRNRIAIDPQHVVSLSEETDQIKPLSILSGTNLIATNVTCISLINGCRFSVEDPYRGTNNSVLQQIQQAKKGTS